jgi:hypothetical protein
VLVLTVQQERRVLPELAGLQVRQAQEYLVQLVLAEILVLQVPLELGLQVPQVQELLVLRVQLALVLLVPLGQLVQE